MKNLKLCLLVLLTLVITSFITHAQSKDEIKVDSKTFGAISARHIGPAKMSGRISAIDAVNNDSRIVYIGAASGGVWKSTNAGTTFKPVFDKHTQSIGAISIDQNHPDTVWVGTGEPWTRNSVSIGNGIFKTTNAGESWKKLGLENTERIARIEINPQNPNIVFVAAMGKLWSSNPERGVFRTNDGGKSWEKVLFIDENTGCADISLDPEDPNILYAAMWDFRRKPYTFRSGGPGSGLFKSEDGGNNWIKIHSNLPDTTLGRIAIDVSPADANTVYASVEAANKKTAFFRSQDNGKTWENMNKTPAVAERPFYFSYVVADPVDTNRVYKPGYGFNFSKDGGKTFTSGMTTSAGGGVHSDLHALWIDPNNTDFMYLGTDGGLYISIDQGGSWRIARNLPISQFYHVSADMESPYNIYGGLQDNGSWYGPSSAPGGIKNSDWKNIGGGDGFYAFRDPSDPNILYKQSQGGNITKSFIKTNETKNIKPYTDNSTEKLRFNWNTPFNYGQKSKNLFVGSQYLHKSADKGDTWERISPDLTTNDPKKLKQYKSGGVTTDNTSAENHCTIITINESAINENIIWVGTDDGNIQVTTDGGANWKNVVQNIPDLPENTWCSYVCPSHFDPNTIYATFDGHKSGDNTPYVFKSEDLGETWISLSNNNLPAYCHIIIQDLINPDLLFLGTEFGLYVSVDDGKIWSQFTGNLPNVSIRDMVIHPREHDLILATHGRGIIIIDDITPLRHLSQELINKDLVFLPSKPYVIRNIGSIQQFNGDDEFIGKNAPQTAILTYYMKKRHVFGQMTIEIFNPEGELIKTLPAGKRRGINRVELNIRKKPPQVPKAKSLSVAGLFGPPLTPGEYTVKITKNDFAEEGNFSIVNDPDSPHNEEDMAIQHQTLMKSYSMFDDLSFLVQKIDDILNGTSKLKKAKISKSLLKKINTLYEKANTIKARVVDTQSDGIYTEDTQLREKITEIYAGVSGYLGKPTNSQINRLNELETELFSISEELGRLINSDLNKINCLLEKNKLQPIKIMSKESFIKKTSNTNN